jgi:hypothetical protein
MAKVCFQMLAFNGEPFIEAAMEAVAPYGPIVATEGPVDYWHRDRGYTQSADRTREILRQYCAGVAFGTWAEKDEMQTAAERFIPADTTHVWLVDSDEVWPDWVLREVIASLDDLDALAFRFNSFWCGFDTIIGGFEERFPVWRIQRWYPGAHWHTHRVPTVMAPDGLPWRLHRSMSEDDTDARGWRCCHYSYVLPQQTRAKYDYYRDRSASMTVPNWFERVYLAWATGDAETRRAIESANCGVHNWLPKDREAHGCRDSYTRRWAGDHPEPIARRLPALRARFDEELRLCQEAQRA